MFVKIQLRKKITEVNSKISSVFAKIKPVGVMGAGKRT